MHGLGNDYIVINNSTEQLSEEAIINLTSYCQRRFSIGADGLLVVCPSQIADIRMRMFNPDGSEAEMCGNGIRCFVKYCYEKTIVKKEQIRVETLAGIKLCQLTIKDNVVKEVAVEMGSANYSRETINITGTGEFIEVPIKIENNLYKGTAISIGNPHCVIFVDDVNTFPVEKIGPKIMSCKQFKSGINVEFVQVINKGELKVRVWERGVGETLACGTGACASAAVANKLGKTKSKTVVHLLGGSLIIDVNNGLKMTGPASKVYSGKIFEE